MQQFSKEAFEHADDGTRAALGAELASVLAERLRDAPTFHVRVQQLVNELRALGHDLWSFDETDRMEVWCPSYHTPSGPGILVTFTTDGVEVERCE